MTCNYDSCTRNFESIYEWISTVCFTTFRKLQVVITSGDFQLELFNRLNRRLIQIRGVAFVVFLQFFIWKWKAIVKASSMRIRRIFLRMTRGLFARESTFNFVAIGLTLRKLCIRRFNLRAKNPVFDALPMIRCRTNNVPFEWTCPIGTNDVPFEPRGRSIGARRFWRNTPLGLMVLHLELMTFQFWN